MKKRGLLLVFVCAFAVTAWNASAVPKCPPGYHWAQVGFERWACVPDLPPVGPVNEEKR